MSLPVTDDTPPDMLAGLMDLNVVLPDGKTVRMSVQRGTPMMDLLVQATSTHCLSPGDYSLQAMGEKGVLPFKPNTPIGALDTFIVKIVEKKSNIRGRAPQVPQSFLNSFRLQVHLPRSQLFVLRVTPDVCLSEIMTHICTEKNLNPEKYEFRHPVKSEEVLDLDKTLGYYKVQELTLVSKGNRTVTGLMSSADMINVKSSKNRQNSVCDSSLSSGSFGSRSGSPVPAINVVRTPPQPPIRKKRRPAPKPPSFIDKEKKDRNFGSVLISHSRESSDSSGYHEASVLSESPTHSGPVSRMDGDSPPDTLPRRSQLLPSSQSFTNLTSIQPAPKGRLISSVSNTSLNSNGCSRKKRIAPPPPQNHETTKVEKTKSSTLPISIAEERRNGTSFMTESSFASAKVDVPLDVSNAKVQIPIEITSRVVNETKASKDEVPSTVDVDNSLPPKPKPRTVLQSRPDSAAEKLITIEPSCRLSDVSSRDIKCASPNRRSNLENLCEEGTSEESSGKFSNSNKASSVVERGHQGHQEEETSFGDRLTTNNDDNNNNNNKEKETGRNKSLSGKSDTREEILSAENSDQTDHDSINWEYQLPPPPTDFRDTNSPSCTEFGTITITPEVFENIDSYRSTQEEKTPSKKSEQIDRSINLKPLVNGFGAENENENSYEYNNHIYRSGSEKKLSQNKTEVMNELTNILNENRKQKEKSLSVNNLYINDSIEEEKRNALNYSRSFSIEPVFSLLNGNSEQRHENGLSNNNKKLSISNEIECGNEITYRNYKNLEKSSSMESIQVSKLDNGVHFIEKSEEIFRKPVAPVQKKLKVARRSASSLGVNTSVPKKRNTTGNSQDSWSDDPSLSVLRQQFLEFLKEKKLMMNGKDFNMKSLDVICNILPEVVKNSNGAEDRVVEEKNEINSQDYAQTRSGLEKEDKVKVVDVKVKPSFEIPSDESTDFLRHEEKVTEEENKGENALKTTTQQKQQKKQELTKRYSYQGPPSINFGTWGERPKTTRIIIKDEDYVTQENVTEKKSEIIQSAAPKPADTDQKPKEVKKTQIIIKKPGVLSHYEMFSALPRKKEISSLQMVFMEEDEKRRKNLVESKTSNRIPVVCGMELKKEFKEVETSNKPQISPQPPVSQEELNKPRHAVSVYINGNREEEGKDKSIGLKSTPSFMIPKRNPTLMPVVKGFRSLDETIPKNRVNVVNSSANNQININIAGCSKEGPIDHNQKWCQQSFKIQTSVSVPPPPPPPNINSIKLKPVSCESSRSKTISQDPRSQLLDEIRNFGGLRKLNKSTVH